MQYKQATLFFEFLKAMLAKDNNWISTKHLQVEKIKNQSIVEKEKKILIPSFYDNFNFVCGCWGRVKWRFSMNF